MLCSKKAYSVDLLLCLITLHWPCKPRGTCKMFWCCRGHCVVSGLCCAVL